MKLKASDHADPEGMRFPITTQTQLTTLVRTLNRAKDESGELLSEEKKAAAIERAKKIAKRKGLSIPKSWQKGKESRREATATMSDQMIRQALAVALDLEPDPDGDGDDDSVQNAGWNYCDVIDVFDDFFVYSYYEDQDKEDNGLYKRGYTLDRNEQPVLGDDVSRVRRVVSYVDYIPTTDETTEAVVAGQLHNMLNRDAAIAVTESDKDARPLIREALSGNAIKESSDEDGALRIQGTAIMPGLNRSGNRVYPKETLAAALPLFSRKKMYIDHPSLMDERNRPERSVMDVGAVIEDAWINESGGIDYRAVVIDPPLMEKLSRMKKGDALDAMGTSVNYYGTANEETFEGKRVDVIESIDDLRSLDFVTEAGAWGDISRMEALDRAARAAETERNDDVADDATIKGLEAQIATLTQTVQAQTEANNREREARVISETKLAVRTALAESGLPEASKKRVIAHYEGATSADGIDEVIEGEKAYIEALKEEIKVEAKGGGQKAGGARPRNNIVVGMGATRASEEEDERPRARTVEESAAALSDFIPGGLAGAQRFVESMS